MQAIIRINGLENSGSRSLSKSDRTHRLLMMMAEAFS